MGKFRGKPKVGLTFGRHKKSTNTIVKATTSASTQYRSPVYKRARVSSTPRKTFASPCVGYKSTCIRKRKLSFSVRLMTSHFRKSPLSKRKTSTPARTTKRQLKFVFTVSLESDDLESIPYESDDEISTTDTKTRASVILDNESSTVSDSVKTNAASEMLHVHQDASGIANLMDCWDSPAEHDITCQIVRFIELVKLKKFPLDNFALRLFLDTVDCSA